MECIGKTIATLRKERNLTQKYVALTSGVQPATLCRIELGTQPPSEAQIIAISQVLEIQPWQVAERWTCRLKQLSGEDHLSYASTANIHMMKPANQASG